jgi:enediyne core biosynthesis thioesterase
MPEAYLYRHRVTFDETNLVGNVYFAHFVHWQGHCRELFLADHAPGVLGALANGLALVTVDCAVEFFGEGRAFDDIELRMSLERLRGNRITMCFDYVRTGPPPAELLAHGRQTVACMRRGGAGLEPSAIPDELRRALAGYAPAGVPA